MPLSNPSQKINPKNLRTFAHHKIRLLLSSLTTSITTNYQQQTTTFRQTPFKNTSKNSKIRGLTSPGFFCKNSNYREADCEGTGSASSFSTSSVTSFISAS
jgi:hypothetical protein